MSTSTPRLPPVGTSGDTETFSGESDRDHDDDDGDALAPGEMVGEYRVEHRIGSGGMGIVFAAVHPLIGKRVAIKVLKKKVCNDTVAVERFIDEARIVNRIEHPNIVDIFAFGQLPDGRNYFVMEWLRGQSLRTRLERGPLTVAQVCDILVPLTRALGAAHKHGIVHRDLKPDNVYLVDMQGEPNEVKLLDFGVAKLNQIDQKAKRVGHTATGTIVGTPQYLSPEQAKGHTIDHRADIYALGAIAFEALSGRPPFEADNVMEMVAKHLMEAPPRPSAFVPNVPFELDELVVATLAKDPGARPELAEWVAVLDRQKQKHEAMTTPRPARTFSAEPSARTTPFPPAAAPWPQAPSPAPVPSPTPAPAPSPSPKRSPRWLVVALVAAPVIAIGVVVVRVYSGPHDRRGEPHVSAPTPEEAAAATPTIAAPPSPSPVPPTPPAPPAIVEPASPPLVAPAPKKEHHHAPAAAATTSHAPPDAQPAPEDDNDLLAPGSIPAGSAAAP